MSYKFEWFTNNPYVTFKGNITFDEIFHVDGLIFGDKRFNSMKYTIYNFLEVNSMNMTEEHLKIISVLDKSASVWNRKLKFVCIAQDPLIKETVLNYINFMEDSSWETRLFETFNEAIGWCRK